jgi:hypothetical protein
MFKVWYSALNYIIVSTYLEARTLQMMVKAASRSNVEPCDIMPIGKLTQYVPKSPRKGL